MSESEVLPPRVLGSLPDVANSSLPVPEANLDWVGMGEVHQAIQIIDGGKPVSVGAKAHLFVNLEDHHAKGIHMSRLYLLLNEMFGKQPLTPKNLKRLCEGMLDSHSGLSSAAFVKFDFEHIISRKALISDNYGWNSYPVKIKATYSAGELVLEMGTEVLYSSACPCSAALARHVIQEQFDERFSGKSSVQFAEVRSWLGTEQGISAVPHSQRSNAKTLVKIADQDADSFYITELVDLLEGALKTPVQTAVKREDEQEFARLNGQNPMFCEDAARKLKKALFQQPAYSDFWVCVNHMESLHAHNAVAVATKGVAGGYLPIVE